jgi:hypothetical protein
MEFWIRDENGGPIFVVSGQADVGEWLVCEVAVCGAWDFAETTRLIPAYSRSCAGCRVCRSHQNPFNPSHTVTRQGNLIRRL